MSKRKTSLHVRLPPYASPRLRWRRSIQRAAIQAQQESLVRYRPEDKLALTVTLYFDRLAVGWHDVDNRLKDVMDALQGRIGGPKVHRPITPIIPNDRQVYQVTVTKAPTPPQAHSRGHVWIRRA